MSSLLISLRLETLWAVRTKGDGRRKAGDSWPHATPLEAFLRRWPYSHDQCDTLARNHRDIFSCGAKRYATIVVVRFIFFLNQKWTNRGLNSTNKHGSICCLGHKFILNLNFILKLMPYLSLRRPKEGQGNLQKFSKSPDIISVSPKIKSSVSPCPPQLC